MALISIIWIKSIVGGDSKTLQSYSLLDNQPLRGTSFYRLKSVDFGGRCSYSETRSVSIKDKTISHFKVYPNPAVLIRM